MIPARFSTLTGSAWASALPRARKRRHGEGKRIAEAITCADGKACAVTAHGVRRIGRASYVCARCGRDVSLAVFLVGEALANK